MCTVLLRINPGTAWPVLLAAVRDEFFGRPWDPPAAHWPPASDIVGGRDRTAGGTWLAVRTPAAGPPAVAALLNGARLPAMPGRPSRGRLVLDALGADALREDAHSRDAHGRDTLGGGAPGRVVPTDLADADLARYDGFHLLLATLDGVRVWTWDGERLTTRDLTPGNHIIVNLGVDTVDDPLVPYFAPQLAALPDPPLTASGWTEGTATGDTQLAGASTQHAWGGWVELLRGDSLPFDDPRALIERRTFDGAVYGSTSASLVALGRDAVRFDFTATPPAPAWYEVALPAG